MTQNTECLLDKEYEEVPNVENQRDSEPQPKREVPAEPMFSSPTYYYSPVKVPDITSLQTVPAGQFDSQSIKIVAKLYEFTKLEQDWDSYGGEPPDPEFLNEIIPLLAKTKLFELTELEVFPLSSGGIQFEWSKEGQEIEVSIYPDGNHSYLVTTESDEKVIEEGTFCSADVVYILRRFID